MTAPTSLRALLRRAIDYAGLFPPASLAMDEAASRYASYRTGDTSWALGRFVVPASRLGELAAARAALGGDAWPVAVLLGGDGVADAATARACADRDGLRVDSAEWKLAPADASSARERIVRVAGALGDGISLFVEIPTHDDPAALVAEIGHAGAAAKMRSGGVTVDAFPSADEVARFLAACMRARVPFKATAGLHHPIRAAYPLTYAADAPTGTMFGFLNVFVAAVLLHAGAEEETARAVLAEEDANAFVLDEDGVAWRDHRAMTAHVDRARMLVRSFGSCSFEEPVADLTRLALL